MNMHSWTKIPARTFTCTHVNMDICTYHMHIHQRPKGKQSNKEKSEKQRVKIWTAHKRKERKREKRNREERVEYTQKSDYCYWQIIKEICNLEGKRPSTPTCRHRAAQVNLHRISVLHLIVCSGHTKQEFLDKEATTMSSLSKNK